MSIILSNSFVVLCCVVLWCGVVSCGVVWCWGAEAGGSEQPHVCSVCGRGFERRSNLVRHKRIHDGTAQHILF